MGISPFIVVFLGIAGLTFAWALHMRPWLMMLMGGFFCVTSMSVEWLLTRIALVLPQYAASAAIETDLLKLCIAAAGGSLIAAAIARQADLSHQRELASLRTFLDECLENLRKPIDLEERGVFSEYLHSFYSTQDKLEKLDPHFRRFPLPPRTSQKPVAVRIPFGKRRQHRRHAG